MVKRRLGKRDDDAAASPDNGANDGSEWRSDPRFGHLATDPRYRSAAVRKATRLQIDSRFKAMFTDPDFTTEVRTDKRGRPVAMSSQNDLSRFYGLKEDDAEASTDDDSEKPDVSENNTEDSDETDKEPSDEGKGHEESADEEEDNEDESDKESASSEDEELRSLERTVSAESLEGAESSVNPTNRLAVTQQDWDQLKPTDLYMLLSSHCQATHGRLLSVTIYPSRFGLQRMSAEVEKGPLELATAAAKSTSSSATDSAAADTAYRKSLLRHQQKRLWYYYAVAEFDSVGAAASVYDECYGLEIESTGCCLRLSYVPDGMQFGEPKDVPDEWRHLVTKCSGIDPAAYKPGKFTTASLGRTQVGLTWDETPTERTRYLQGLFGKAEFDEADPDLKRLSEFLALSSEDEADDSGTGGTSTAAADAAKRRALLGLSDDAKPAGEDEVAVFSDDELPDDIAAAASVPAATTDATHAPAESRKRSRRRRLREQAKRAKLIKAGLLPPAGGGSSEDKSDGDESSAGAAEMPASEQELAMLVADRPLGQAGPRSRVTAGDVESDARFGALFTDPSYHVDPTHSEAAKAAEVQRLITSAKKRVAKDT